MNIDINVDPDLCIGSATCLRLAPGVFALDEDEVAAELRRDPDIASVITPEQGGPPAQGSFGLRPRRPALRRGADARVRRAGAAAEILVRADSAFWNKKVIAYPRR